MENFKQYRRKSISEMKPVPSNWTLTTLKDAGVSVSQADLDNGSPKVGDMIARNPKNHKDQWLVAKEYFENNLEPINIEKDNLTFGLAIEALKQGNLVARKGWNGKGMFIMKQIPAEISLEIIPKMQSVQQAAKDKLIEANTTLKYCNQMLIIKPDGTADSWVASSSDIFAEDWFILE